MKVRSKAPLRLGIAGGGTDVSPYSDEYGGCVLNATINMYAHTFIEVLPDSAVVEFFANDIDVLDSFEMNNVGTIKGPLPLHRAVYIRVMEDFNNGEYIPLRVITYCDAPPGSGLGSSSALVVSMLAGFKQLMGLPLGEYDIAHLAYDIERVDCGLRGGKQDQYAATFGGFNFMEFRANDQIIVNPLRIRRYIINELESSLILFFMGVSRDSAKIIDDQIRSTNVDVEALNAMHKVKENSYLIKEALLKADINKVASLLKLSWEAKKLTSSSVSNPDIAAIETGLSDIGAKSMKVSGAGGGGFLMIFVEPDHKFDISNRLNERFGESGQTQTFNFTSEGSLSWTI